MKRNTEGRSLDTVTLARQIADALADRQAEEIVLLDISLVCGFTDYFVIASATSRRQFEALAEALDALPGPPARREGSAQSGWVLFDFGNVVAHIFTHQERDYYQLETLWAAGKQLLRIE